MPVRRIEEVTRVQTHPSALAPGVCDALPGLSGRRVSAALLLFATILVLAASGRAFAGAYIFAGSSNGVDLVTHPSGYTGIGGSLNVSVCIEPGSPNAAAMAVPIQNAIAKLNALVPTTANLVSGAANDIPSGHLDFESAALHELGHCVGLAHPNLGATTGVSSTERNYTKTTSGADGSYDVAAGADGIRGSADDIRGDDENLH